MRKFKLVIIEIDKAIIFGSICLLLIDKNIRFNTFNIHGAIILKIFILFQCYVFWNELILVLKEIRYFIPNFKFDTPKRHYQYNTNTSFIDGIDTNKLINYIFDSGKMAYEDMRTKFNISPKNYKKLGQNLEKINILERGLNNARILKNGLDKFNVMKHISQFRNSDEITPLLRWDGGNAVVI